MFNLQRKLTHFMLYVRNDVRVRLTMVNRHLTSYDWRQDHIKVMSPCTSNSQHSHSQHLHRHLHDRLSYLPTRSLIRDGHIYVSVGSSRRRRQIRLAEFLPQPKIRRKIATMVNVQICKNQSLSVAARIRLTVDRVIVISIDLATVYSLLWVTLTTFPTKSTMWLAHKRWDAPLEY